MKADELRVLYSTVVVTSCEWRTIGLADPQQLADQVFATLERQSEIDLHDLYEVLERVAVEAFSRYAERATTLDRLITFGRFKPAEEVRDMLAALSRLRQADRDLLQRRYWDSLDLLELAESFRTSPEQARARLVRAEERFLGKARRFDRGLTPAEIGRVVASLKPGEHTRYPAR